MQDAGKVTAEIAQAHAESEFEKYRIVQDRLEQTAIYCGLRSWAECIAFADTDLDKALHKRMIDVMSHADYLIQEPEDLNEKFKDDFRKIFKRFIAGHSFNRALVANAVAP